MRALCVIAATVCVALVSAPTALADDYKMRLTPAGKAAARAVALTKADIGPAGGWTGGPVKPDNSTDPPCKNYNPKHSDLVVIGTAASDWDHSGINLHSEVAVLATARMLQLDWQRSNAPGELDCARAAFAKTSTATERIVSLKRMPFPQVAKYTAAFRVVIDVRGASKEIIRMVSDIVFFGRGRTEVTLLTTAPLAAMASVRPAEVALARKMVARIRA